MASASWKQDDRGVGSISSNETKTHVDLRLLWTEDAHRGTGGPIPSQFSSLQISSLSVENLYGHPQNLSDTAAESLCGHAQNLSSVAMHDLTIKPDVGDFSNYPLEPAFGQSTLAGGIVPFLGYEDPSFPGRQVTMTVDSGWQTNMMDANHDMNRRNGGKNLIDPKNNGAGNFHMARSDEALANNTRQLDDTNRSLCYLSTAPEIPHKPDFVQKAYNNQLRVNGRQLDHLNKLDGRFLSLGYQSNPVCDGQSEACCHTSFSHLGQLADDYLNKFSIPLSGFGENVRGLNITQGHSSNMNLSHNDGGALQTMTSAVDSCANPALPGREIDMEHFIPIPSIKSSGSMNEIGLKFSSIDTFQGCGANPAIGSNVSNLFPQTMQRMTQRIPLNSPVLRSNHQNASDQMQNSHLRTNMKLPRSGETSRQDQSGQLYPANAASNGGADEGFKIFHSGVSKSASQVYPLNVRQDINSTASTGQGAVVTAENGLFHPSSSLGRRSWKRSLPPLSPTPEQRKKIIIPTSTDPFSPYLLKNALGQIGESLPAFTTSTNHSLIPSVAMKGSAASNSTNLMTVPASASTIEAFSAVARASMHPTYSAEAFISSTQAPAAYTSLGSCIPAICNPAPANIPAISVVAGERHRLFPPPITFAASSALGRNTADRTGLLRVPVNANPSKAVVPQTLPPSLCIPVPATVSHRKSSSMASSAVSPLRKRLPELAASAKASPAFRTAQFPSSASHIKWQGFEMPRPIGEKCLLCKRDLSYSPEGPISTPPTAPAVAVLPCAHTFHDDCLSRITPADQSKDPPCIPCAIGEK